MSIDLKNPTYGRSHRSDFLFYAPAMEPGCFYIVQTDVSQPHTPESMGMTCFLRDMILGRNAQLLALFWMLNA